MLDVLRLRLANQLLLDAVTDDPGRVVAHLGAVQAQDYPAALWALGLRLPRTTQAELECAFARGAMLRTHVLRPTWHFVAPEDIRWMLALTGPRVKRAMAHRDRELGLTDALVDRSNVVIADTLRGSKHLTRAELIDALRASGIDVSDGSVLAHLLSHAELDAVICSGAPRGKLQTYALLEERVLPARDLGGDDAVQELVRRYFTSHGPATLTDFAWWSGLTVAHARRALTALGTFASESIDGKTYWFSAEALAASPAVDDRTAWLLPNFDEYTLAYRERAIFYPHAVVYRPGPRDDVPFSNVIVIGGTVVGFWKRTLARDRVSVSITPTWLSPPTRAHAAAFDHAAARYLEFKS